MKIDEWTWVDMTIVGSSYEVQTRLRKMCGIALAVAVYRHREALHSLHNQFAETPWVDGLPPKG